MKPAKQSKIGSFSLLASTASRLGSRGEALLFQFTEFLKGQQLSPKSIKNYVSDVRRFIAHMLETTGAYPDLVDLESEAKGYKARLLEEATPLSTINRHLASLRQFGAFLNTVHQAGVRIDELHNVSIIPKALKHDTRGKIFEQFRDALRQANYSEATVENYVTDARQFSQAIQLDELFSLEHIKANVDRFLEDQKKIGALSSTVKRKFSSIRRFYAWATEAEYLERNPFQSFAEIAGIEAVKLAQKAQKKAQQFVPLGFFERNRAEKTESANPTDGTLEKQIEKIRPQLSAKKTPGKLTWRSLYERYTHWPISSYLHLSVLVLFVALIAIFGYDQIFKNAGKSLAYPTSLVTPNRILSFQGRLTDTALTPITIATNVKFRLFDDPTVGVGDGAALWASGTCSITPDQDGVFTTLLGSSCGGAIPASVFSENANVYLEVQVASETLTPRQQIATVGYALNAETLQGYPASASAVENTVPVFNNSGQMLIGLASPTIRSTSGTFVVQGNALTLSTNTGTNGNITIAPDGTGQINVLGGTTTTDFINISNANLTTGTLVKGTVGNNNTGYKFLSFLGGSSPSERFSVNALGGVNTVDSIRTPVATISATYSGSTPLIINGTGGQIFSITNGGIATLNNLASGALYSASGVISSETVLSSVRGGTGANLSLAAQGAVPYFSSTGVMSALPPSTSGFVLQTQGAGQNPIWSDPSTLIAAVEFWTSNLGALFPKNSTLDVFVGGQTTASAKFAFINVNSGTPTASISAGTNGATYLTADGTLNTTARQTLTLGGTNGGAVQIAPTGSIAMTVTQGGNVGIGTTTPGNNLTVVGASGSDIVKIIPGTGSVGDSGYLNVNSRARFGFDGAGNIIIDDSGTTKNLMVNLGGSSRLSVLNNGNVGIGSTNPQFKLDVAGDTRIQGYASVSASLAVGYSSVPAGVGNAVFSGNVGIGSPVPQQALDVQGNFKLTGTTTFGGLTYTWPGSQTTNYVLQTNGSGTLSWVDPAGAAASAIYWNQNLGALFPKNSTVDVLVGGQTTASAKFAFINVNSGTPTASISGNLALGSPAGANAANTLDILNGGTFNFRNSVGGGAGLTSRFFIDSAGNNGNIGIGTTSPTQLVELLSAIGDTQLVVRRNAAGTSGLVSFLPNSGSGSPSDPQFSMGKVFSTTGFSVASWDGSTTRSVWYIDTSWNTGIGTTSPGAKLQVYNDGSSGSILPSITADSNGLTQMKITSSNGTSGKPVALLFDPAGGPGNEMAFVAQDASQTVGELRLVYPTTGGDWNSPTNTIATFQSGGSIGIGTTSPLATLDLRYNSGTTSVASISGTSSFATLVLDNRGSGDLFTASTGGVPKFVIRGNGNVGIGSPVPQQALDVQGNFKLTGTTTFGGLTYTWPGSQSTNYILQTNGSGTLSWVDPSGAAASAIYWTQNLGALFPKNSTVDVLVGGQTTDSAKFAFINVSAGTPTASISAGTNGAVYLTATGTLNTTARQTLTLGGTSGGAIQFAPTGALAATITQAGNLGIGTSAPTTMLHILGTTNTASDNFFQVMANNASQGVAIGWENIRKVGSNANSDLFIDAKGTGGVFINSSATGNVGVGTTAASAGFEVQSAQHWVSNFFFPSVTSGNNIDTVIGKAQATAQALVVGYHYDSTPDNAYGYISNYGDNVGTGLIVAKGGNVGMGTISTLAALDLRYNLGTVAVASISGTTSFATLVLDNRGSGDLFTASTGGVPKFVIQGNGNVGIGSPVPQQALDVQGNFKLTGTTTFNTRTYTWPGSETLNYVLQTNGSGVLSWVDPGSAAASNSDWTTSLGALFPKNSTLDVLVGGQTTASAKFAFINVSAGTPTASVSAGTAGATYLTADGTLATTARQTLTLGGANTGAVQMGTGGTTFLTLAQSGNFGIGTAFPTSKLQVIASNNTGGTVASTSAIYARVNNLAGGTLTASYGIYIDSPINTGSTITQTYGLYIADPKIVGGSSPNRQYGIYVAGSNGRNYLEDNLGIGTNNPSSFKLQVEGSIGPNTDNSSSLGNDATHSGRFRDIFLGPGSVHLVCTTGDGCGQTLDWVTSINTSTGAYQIAPNTATAFTITQGGNVGVGTTTPSFGKLEVAGTGTSLGGAVIGLNEVGVRTWYIGAGKAVSGKLTFGTGASTNIMTLDGSGNVGIGTTNPINAFAVGSTGQFQVDLSGNLAAASSITSAGNITFSTFTTAGGLLYTNGSGLLTQLTSQGSAGNCLLSNGTGAAPSFSSCAAGTGANFWATNLGSLFPINSTWDTFIGGQTTASAKFAFINVNSGTPTASISGNLALGSPTGLTAANTFDILNGGTLNFRNSIGGGAGLTSRFFMDSAGNLGNIGIGTTTPLATLDLRYNKGTTPVASISGVTSFATLVVDNTGVGDIFAASASGGSRFVIANNGKITIPIANNPGVVLGNGTSGYFTIGRSQILDDGTNLRINGGSSSTIIINNDLQITGNDIFDGGGNARISFDQTLNRITMSNSSVGINTSVPLGSLDVRAITTGSGGTLPVATISGKTSFAALVVDNSGVGDIFTASASGANRFVITSTGLVGVGTTLPTAGLEIHGTNASAFLLLSRDNGGVVTNGNDAGSIQFRATSDTLTNPVGADIRGIVSGVPASGVVPMDLQFRTVTSGGAFTNIMRLTTGGNVGVNTTTPGNTFAVAVNSTADPSAGGLFGMTINNNDNTTSALEGIEFYAADSGNTQRHGAAIASGKDGTWTSGSGIYPGFLSFWTRPNANSNESERMRINSSGNVGIGTTSPTSLLHLYSTSTSTSFAASMFDWEPSAPTTTSADLYTFKIGPIGDTTGKVLNVLSDTTSLFNISESQIQSNLPHAFTAPGDVSIAYDLQFTNQMASYIKSNAPLYIQAGESFESNNLTFQVYNSGGFVWQTNGATTSAVLTSAGNLGIGTSNPDSALVVSKNTSALTAPFSNAIAHFSAADTVATLVELDAYGAGPILFFRSSNGTAASPNPVGSGGTLGSINFTGYGSTSFNNNSGAKIVALATETWTDTTLAAALAFNTRPPLSTGVSVERMRIDANGNVGIASTAPLAPLEVDSTRSGRIITGLFRGNPGATGAGNYPYFGLDNTFGTTNRKNQLELDSVGVTQWALGNDVSGIGGDNFFIYSNIASATRLLIDSAGNVGLGTTSPTARLEVVGDASISGSLVTNGATPSVDVLNNSNLLFKFSPKGDAGLSEKVRIMNNGNVGIGSTAPSGPLDVALANNQIAKLGTSAVASAIWGTSIGLLSQSSLAQISSAAVPIVFYTGGTFNSMTAGTERMRIDNANGNVSIGTTDVLFQFTAQDTQAATYVATVRNASTSTNADGLLIRIDENAATNESGEYFIGFSHNGTIGGKIQGAAAATVTVAYTANGTDFAEYFPANDPLNKPAFGDVITLAGTGKNTVGKSGTGSYPIGVYTDSASFIGGDAGNCKENDDACEVNYLKDKVLVGLVGQVRTKVSTINGAIHKGDFLAASSIPGIAQRATVAGPIVGQAQEDYSSPDLGKITALIKPTWYDPDVVLTSDQDFSIESTNYNVPNPVVTVSNSHETITRVGAYTEAVIGKLRSGFISTKSLSADYITIAGQNMSDYVTQIVNNVLDARVTVSGIIGNTVNTFFVQQKLTAPVADISSVNSNDITSNSVHTTTITPVATGSSGIAIRLDPSLLSILNTTDSSHPALVAQIDNTGNATFSGEVQAASFNGQSSRVAILQAAEATISGTLYANNIDGLDDKVIAAAQAALDRATSSGAITYTPPQDVADLIASLLPSTDASTEAVLAQLNAQTGKNLTTADVSAPKVSLVEDLLAVKGLAEFNTANFSTGLSVGSTLTLSQNSIDVANTTLYLEPSGTGSIDLLAGVMTLESNGLVNINGNLYVSDAIYSKEQHTSSLSISPLNPNTSLPAEPASISGGLGKLLALYDDQGNLVSSIDASGSAAVKELITQQVIVAAPSASNSGGLGGLAQSNATAGTAILPANTTSITIGNTNVTDNTLIYITPISNTHNQVLYVSSKLAGHSFTVSTNLGIGEDITFNYWLIKIQQ